jgi:hypothetical protein
MAPENSRAATGYPPVTETEEQAAADKTATPRPASQAGRLDSGGKAIVDAVAGVFGAHRGKIDAMPLDLEVKRYALDLLDAVFLDVLHTVLSQSPTFDKEHRDRAAG